MRLVLLTAVFLHVSALTRAAVLRVEPTSVIRAAPPSFSVPSTSVIPLGAPASLNAPSAVAASAVILPAAAAVQAAAPAAVSAAPAPVSAAPSAVPVAPSRAWEPYKPALARDTAAWRFKDPFFGSARMWDGSRELERLGSGAFGTVFAHPTRDDAVVKMARRGFSDREGGFMSDDEEVMSWEDHDLLRLAEAGAAPRPLERATVSGRPGSVRERIHGRTVASLGRARAFGPREKALVWDMIDRVARAGYVATDLNLGNLMIGRRKGDAEDRAWIVDPFTVHEARDSTFIGRRDRMRSESVAWLAFHGFGLGRPLEKQLDSLVRRAR